MMRTEFAKFDKKLRQWLKEYNAAWNEAIDAGVSDALLVCYDHRDFELKALRHEIVKLDKALARMKKATAQKKRAKR